MKYIYDVVVNLNKEFINFYEWDTNDTLTKVKRLPIFKLNNYDYNTLLSNRIKIDKYFMELLDDKMCLFCNDYDSLCIKFDNDGNGELYSKLSIESEVEVLDIILREKPKNIKYKVLDKIKYSFNSREVNDKLKRIIDFINENKTNSEAIKYLSYECMNKVVSYNKLIEYIKNTNVECVNKIYEIIKLTQINV